MAGFGHVMKILIGVGFSRMGFPGYIVCLYVVGCDNLYFSLIIMLMLLAFNLTTGIKAMVLLGYARWFFYVESNCKVHVQWYPTP